MGKDELKRLSKRQLIRMVLERDALLAKMAEQVQMLEQRVVVLERELARARKDSSTSSKPPSSDIVKPPKTASKKGGRTVKRKIGGQPGHEKHEREPFDPDEIDAFYQYGYNSCPDCGGELQDAAGPPRVIQQVELVERPFRVTEHWSTDSWCPRCRVRFETPLPGEVVRGGLFGPRMSAFVAYLKGGCHASYTTIQALLADVLGVPVSTGFLTKVIGRARAALTDPCEELRDALADEPWLNVDETGHKDRGRKHWTWYFRAKAFSVFKIDQSRGSQVLEEVLGEAFGGVLGSDYFSAYRKYMGDDAVLVQFCLAHLVRDVRYLTMLSDKVTRNYGQRLLDALKAMFQVLHRREVMKAERFTKAMEQAKARVIAKALSAPPRSEAQNIAERFRKHGKSYFTFMTTPGVKPTNNSAEQGIRHVVIDRRITQGTRGENGQRWCERIWTTMATCAQQRRSAFNFLHAAIRAWSTRTAPPSLLPTASMASGP